MRTTNSAHSTKNLGSNLLYPGIPGDLAGNWEDKISVIVPTFSEGRNLPEFFGELLRVLRASKRQFEILIADDHSRDGTEPYIHRLAQEGMPVRLLDKKGSIGKSRSIIESILATNGDTIIIAPANLRYPIEVLSLMLDELQSTDVVLANRVQYASFLRKVRSTIMKVIFKFFLKIPYDVQTNMKVFRRSALMNMPLRSGLGFDVQFLSHAMHQKLRIAQVPILHGKRRNTGGRALSIDEFVGIILLSVQLSLSRLMRFLFPFLFPPEAFEYYAAGYSTASDFLYLSPSQSAKFGITKEIVSLFYVTAIFAVLVVFLLSKLLGLLAIQVIFAGIGLMYFAILAFKLYLVWVALQSEVPPVTANDIARLESSDYPTIGAMIPLYHEGEVVPQIANRMKQMQYPSGKFNIYFVLEADDRETLSAIQEQQLPGNFHIITVPDYLPKTKPKALNAAFPQVQGDVLVIYDAEVLPEPDQLQKVALAFKQHPEENYLHVRMDHYNAEQNWLTALFNGEFCFFYNLYFPGLVKKKFPIPLSGHSTYFRRSMIEHLHGWDAYNVAEDCDIGIRIFRAGFGSGMLIDSFTWEQATHTLPTWFHQRRRWIQGFIQTAMTQLRFPILLKDELGGWGNFFCFLLSVPGYIFISILNIFLWLILAVWLTSRLGLIEYWFNAGTAYISSISFIVGNYSFILLTMTSTYYRRHYRLVKYALLMPFYWVLLGICTIASCVSLILHPHRWDKTRHFLVSQQQ